MAKSEQAVTVRDWHAYRIGCAVLDALAGARLEVAFDVGTAIASNPAAVDAIMAGVRHGAPTEGGTDDGE